MVMGSISRTRRIDLISAFSPEYLLFLSCGGAPPGFKKKERIRLPSQKKLKSTGCCGAARNEPLLDVRLRCGVWYGLRSTSLPLYETEDCADEVADELATL